MDERVAKRFSGAVNVFHDQRLPETAVPAGYAALIDAYNLPVPLPRVLAAIGSRHKMYETDGWRIYTPRHQPAAELAAHLNETADFYRFFDATPHAEFLFSCVARTIAEDLPAEAAFLRAYDTFRSRVSLVIDMPERMVDLLFRFLRQNGGRLSQRSRGREFAALTNAEVARIEAIYDEIRPALADVGASAAGS